MEDDTYVPTYCGPSYTDLPMEVRKIVYYDFAFDGLICFLDNCFFGVTYCAMALFIMIPFILPNSRDEF